MSSDQNYPLMASFSTQSQPKPQPTILPPPSSHGQPLWMMQRVRKWWIIVERLVYVSSSIWKDVPTPLQPPIPWTTSSPNAKSSHGVHSSMTGRLIGRCYIRHRHGKPSRPQISTWPYPNPTTSIWPKSSLHLVVSFMNMGMVGLGMGILSIWRVYHQLLWIRTQIFLPNSKKHPV